MNKSRLEAFSDGVIAIIITIMVLEVKVPHGVEWSDLAPLLPVFLSYVLSFIFVGIYWGNHHHLLHTVKTVSSRIIWSNMLLLFWLSLTPFAAGWMGENHFARNPVIIYSLILLMCGISFTILQMNIQRTNQLSEEVISAYGIVKKKGIVSVACYTSAIPLAYVNPLISCALFVIVAVIWFIPDKHLEKALRSE